MFLTNRGTSEYYFPYTQIRAVAREILGTVQQISARPLNFRTFAPNMHEFMCPISSDPLYLFFLILHGFTYFCAFYTPSSVRFVSGACLGIHPNK